MNIVLATPLYPPDTAPSAQYVKELARRLSKEHSVTLVTYGTLPEQIPGVSIHAISKQQPLVLRLLAYTIALAKAAARADFLYVENGASVELPIALIGLFNRTPMFIHNSDTAAVEHAATSRIFGRIERAARARAKEVVTEMPLPRPEILPLSPRPTEALAAYEASWSTYLERLNFLFRHA